MSRHAPLLLCLLLPFASPAQAQAEALPTPSGARAVARAEPLILRPDPVLVVAPQGAATPAATGPADAATEWVGRMTASLALTAGNSQTTAARLDLDVAKRRASGKTSVLAAVSESQSGRGARRESTAGRWAGTVEHDRDLDADHFAFARVGAAHDRILDLRLRTQLAIGVGRHVLREADETLDASLGVGRSVSRYRGPKSIGGQTDTRFASNVVVLGNEYTRRFTPHVQLKQRLEGTFSIDGDRNQALHFSTVLSVDMTRTLALTVAFTDAYTRRVAEGQRRNDAALTTGLSLRLGS